MAYYDENGNPVVVEKEVVETRDGGTVSNVVWAIAAIIIFAMLAFLGYYGLQKLNRNTKHDVDIKIDAPAVNR